MDWFNWRAHWRRLLAPLMVSLVLFVTACQPADTSPYAQTQKESTERGAQPAVAKNATQGSKFNRYFPKDQAGYNVVFSQEKKGFSEAKLNKGGKTMAMLAVSDAASDSTGSASPTQKFAKSTTQISGYPAVDVGTTQTAVLVNNRYQVKVLGRDPAFTKADRAAWLQKFDLNGLSKLK